jgi:hypothetical protein
VAALPSALLAAAALTCSPTQFVDDVITETRPEPLQHTYDTRLGERGTHCAYECGQCHSLSVATATIHGERRGES